MARDQPLVLHNFAPHIVALARFVALHFGVMSRRVVQLNVNTPVLLLKERRSYIAFAPAFDLSASGTSPDRARKNFDTTLRIFLEELVERGTLEQVLRDLGWSKQSQKWQPPVEIAKTATVPVQIPIAA